MTPQHDINALQQHAAGTGAFFYPQSCKQIFLWEYLIKRDVVIAGLFSKKLFDVVVKFFGRVPAKIPQNVVKTAYSAAV